MIPLVLVNAEAYECLIEDTYDDSPWTNDEMNRLAAEDADMLGWDGMDIYQDAES